MVPELGSIPCALRYGSDVPWLTFDYSDHLAFLEFILGSITPFSGAEQKNILTIAVTKEKAKKIVDIILDVNNHKVNLKL